MTFIHTIEMALDFASAILFVTVRSVASAAPAPPPEMAFRLTKQVRRYPILLEGSSKGMISKWKDDGVFL